MARQRGADHGADGTDGSGRADAHQSTTHDVFDNKVELITKLD